MVSLLTNVGAMTALRTYEAAGAELSAVSRRVSTGLRVTGALDDASNFSIVQGLRTELRAWGVVAQGLATSAGVVDVGLAASTTISNLLSDLKTKAIEYHDADDAGKIIIQNDANKLLEQINMIADNANFNGHNLVNRDQTSVAVTPPADEGTAFVFTGTGSNNHTIGTTSGTVTVTWSRTGTGGGTLQLSDGGGLLGTQSHSPANTSGSFGGYFDASNGTDITIQRLGSPGVTLTYSFSFTPDISASVLGEFVVPSDLNGGVIDLQHRSMRTDGLGIDGLNLGTLDAAGTVAQIDAAMQEVNQNLGYYGAKRRQMSSSIEIARTMQDALTVNIGNLVDADMAKDSAKLTATQIQRQLAQQSLSIANSAPNTLLTLFQSAFG